MTCDIDPTGTCKALQNVVDELGRAVNALRDYANWPQSLWNPLKDAARPVVNTVWDGFIVQTRQWNADGPFIADPTVLRFEPPMQVIANAALVIVTMWAAYRIMWAHSARSQFGVRIMLPRVLLSVALINFSLPLFQLFIDANNALCLAVASFNSFPALEHYFAIGFDFALPNLATLTTAALVFGYVALAIAYVIRYTILVLLAITAPVAALLFVLPETHHWARLWSTLFITNLLMQPVQLLILAIGFALESRSSDPVGHMFAIAALLVVFRVPGAMNASAKVASKAGSMLHHEVTQLVRVAVKAAA